MLDEGVQCLTCDVGRCISHSLLAARQKVSANENSCAHYVTWSPNKLWITNSIFNLCYVVSVHSGEGGEGGGGFKLLISAVQGGMSLITEMTKRVGDGGGWGSSLAY
jgi:hypothetical protein